MADLTTTPNGIWILQALLGVEKMPTALRLRPFIPSVDGDGTVATELGDVPWSQTAEYNSLAAAGVIDQHGRVDDAVRDWMAVVGTTAARSYCWSSVGRSRSTAQRRTARTRLRSSRSA